MRGENTRTWNTPRRSGILRLPLPLPLQFHRSSQGNIYNKTPWTGNNKNRRAFSSGLGDGLSQHDGIHLPTRGTDWVRDRSPEDRNTADPRAVVTSHLAVARRLNHHTYSITSSQGHQPLQPPRPSLPTTNSVILSLPIEPRNSEPFQKLIRPRGRRWTPWITALPTPRNRPQIRPYQGASHHQPSLATSWGKMSTRMDQVCWSSPGQVSTSTPLCQSWTMLVLSLPKGWAKTPRRNRCCLRNSRIREQEYRDPPLVA